MSVVQTQIMCRNDTQVLNKHSLHSMRSFQGQEGPTPNIKAT